MYAEDMDLCWRLHKDGWRVGFEPSAEVAHAGNAAASQKFGAAVDDIRLAADYTWYLARHGRRQARLWSMANMLGFGVKSVIGRARWGAPDPRLARTKRFFWLHARKARRL